MKSASRAEEETNSSARTFPVHSTGAGKGSVEKIRTSGCFSCSRASRAPWKPRPVIGAGFAGSLEYVVDGGVFEGSVESRPEPWRKYGVSLAGTGQSLAVRHSFPGAPFSPTAPIT